MALGLYQQELGDVESPLGVEDFQLTGDAVSVATLRQRSELNPRPAAVSYLGQPCGAYG